MGNPILSPDDPQPNKPRASRTAWIRREPPADATETRAELAPMPAASPYVFVNASPSQSHRVKRAGLPLVSRLVLRIVREVVGPIVGRKVYTHMLRHSFASRLRENGADLQDIQEALGHSVITTTTMYAHISTRRRREKLAEYLK
jgi:site-specific recombinase XerD